MSDSTSRTSNVAAKPLDFERFRGYLLLLAKTQLGMANRFKVEASDVVQHVLLEAHEHRTRFRGNSDAELAGWLRQILACSIANIVRDQGRQKRDRTREKSLQAELNESSARLEAWLVADQSSPSRHLQQQEQMLRVAAALAQLPDGQRAAMVLRHCQGMALVDIAKRMGCSAPTVVGYLERGTKKLQEILDAPASLTDV